MVRIGNKTVGDPGHCYVVAEIGINHNGDLKEAFKLIDLAVEAGCDAVKFQKRTIPIVYSPEELAAPREVPVELLSRAIEARRLPGENVHRLNTEGFDKSTNGDQKYMLEFGEVEYEQIADYCRTKGIDWFASPWDEEAIDFLEQFDPVCYKVASASLTDDDLLRHMRSKGRPIILSTGMSDLPMIRHAVEVVGTDDLVLLHCTSVYPTVQHSDMDRGLALINLVGLDTLREEFPGVPIGFSSHDLGIMPSYAAAVKGACMIEKHVTLWRGGYGSDQGSSIEPDDLKKLVRAVRELPTVLGNGEITFYEEERAVAKKLRRKG